MSPFVWSTCACWRITVCMCALHPHIAFSLSLSPSRLTVMHTLSHVPNNSLFLSHKTGTFTIDALGAEQKKALATAQKQMEEAKAASDRKQQDAKAELFDKAKAAYNAKEHEAKVEYDAKVQEAKAEFDKVQVAYDAKVQEAKAECTAILQASAAEPERLAAKIMVSRITACAALPYWRSVFPTRRDLKARVFPFFVDVQVETAAKNALLLHGLTSSQDTDAELPPAKRAKVG